MFGMKRRHDHCCCCCCEEVKREMEIRYEQRECVWKGDNLQEIVDTIEHAFDLERIVFGRDRHIELVCRRRDYDVRPGSEERYPLWEGDVLTVKAPVIVPKRGRG